MKQALIPVITSILVFALAPTLTLATDFYVSSSGSDVTGNGSSSSPWATIAHADQSGLLQPGDIVHVASGTYTGSFPTYTSGTASAPITYVSDAKWGAVLVGTSGSVWGNRGSYIQIIGFQVVGSDQGENGIYTQGSDTVIIGNDVHGVLPTVCNGDGGSGINLNGPNARVIANLVYNNGASSCSLVHGIYFLQPGGLAAANIAFANGGHGIQLWACASNEVIYNNTLFNNSAGGIVVGADCASPANQIDDFTVVDNNICFANARGITEEGSYVVNGQTVLATGPHNIYHNNLVYENPLAAISLQSGTEGSTVAADPLFVNYTGGLDGNYHLTSDSPGVDAGLSGDSIPGGGTVTFIPYSFNGAVGVQGCCFDLGAYQFVPLSGEGDTQSRTLGGTYQQ